MRLPRAAARPRWRGACCWAPAIQVNYDFHDDLTPQHVTGILETYRGRAKAEGKVSNA